jgi:hypothetical protein
LQAAALNSVKRQKNDYSPDESMLRNIDFLPVYSAGLREMIKKGVNHPEHYDTPLKGIKVRSFSRYSIHLEGGQSPGASRHPA